MVMSRGDIQLSFGKSVECERLEVFGNETALLTIVRGNLRSLEGFVTPSTTWQSAGAISMAPNARVNRPAATDASPGKKPLPGGSG